jgi:hypothetical protein
MFWISLWLFSFSSWSRVLRSRFSIDHVLDIPPQEEVWRSRIRGIWWPLNVVVETRGRWNGPQSVGWENASFPWLYGAVSHPAGTSGFSSGTPCFPWLYGAVPHPAGTSGFSSGSGCFSYEPEYVAQADRTPESFRDSSPGLPWQCVPGHLQRSICQLSHTNHCDICEGHRCVPQW